MNFIYLILILSAFSLIGIVTLVYPLDSGYRVRLSLLTILVATLGISYYKIGGWFLVQAHYKKQQQQQYLNKLLAKVNGVPGIIKEFNQRLKKNPNSARGWFLLGRLYLKQNQLPQAKEAFAKAYRLNPDSSAVQINYAITLWQLHRRFSSEIINLLEAVLAKDPKQADALSLLAMQAFQATRYQLAINYWQRLLNLVEPHSKEAELLDQAIIKAKMKLKDQNLPSAS